MLLMALGLIAGGYTLAYAGIRGAYWNQPWALWFGDGIDSSGVPEGPTLPPSPGPAIDPRTGHPFLF